MLPDQSKGLPPEPGAEAVTLLPCPFCGAAPRIIDEEPHGCQVFCGCDAGPLIALRVGEMQQAAAAWNTRAAPAQPDAALPNEIALTVEWVTELRDSLASSDDPHIAAFFNTIRLRDFCDDWLKLRSRDAATRAAGGGTT